MGALCNLLTRRYLLNNSYK